MISFICIIQIWKNLPVKFSSVTAHASLSWHCSFKFRILKWWEFKMGFLSRCIILHNLTLNETLTWSLTARLGHCRHVDELLTGPKQMSTVALEDLRHQHAMIRTRLIADQRFSLKLWFAGSAHSRGLWSISFFLKFFPLVPPPQHGCAHAAMLVRSAGFLFTVDWKLFRFAKHLKYSISFFRFFRFENIRHSTFHRKRLKEMWLFNFILILYWGLEYTWSTKMNDPNRPGAHVWAPEKIIHLYDHDVGFQAQT